MVPLSDFLAGLTLSCPWNGDCAHQDVPKVQYIEAWNEPDAPGSTIQPAQVYQSYIPLYQAVNSINHSLSTDRGYTPLEVGGPALYYFNTPLLTTFLDAYVADSDPDKRLDFVSYHAYVNVLPDGSRQFYKSDPSLVKGYRDQLDSVLAERGLPENLPVYITETGIPARCVTTATAPTTHVKLPACHHLPTGSRNSTTPTR
ncbi:glycosyl hydrolase [Rhodococcus sp. KBS0724]|uniref:glycosyl hydrolase n=1 Tax=Rhodococcus sp. KBS0724 TaxID=1179674 RepID=UPI00163DCB59|nr:glycosyl hydrolase [Rhodococcus sp. KBS0724]